MKTIIKSILFTVALALVMTGCQKETDNISVSLKSSATSTRIIDVWNPAGGAIAECEAAGGSCGYAYKWNQDPDGGGELLPPLGLPNEGAPNGTIVTPDGNSITILNSDGKTFDWISVAPVCKVIVKAGRGAIVYYYDPAVTHDEGLIGFLSKGISHISFCHGDLPAMVIAFKTGLSNGIAYTFVESQTGFLVDYYPFVTGVVGKIYYDGNINLPVGNITVGNFDADDLLEVRIDHSDMSDVSFENNHWLFVGTLQQFNACGQYANQGCFPYTWFSVVPTESLIYDLGF